MKNCNQKCNLASARIVTWNSRSGPFNANQHNSIELESGNAFGEVPPIVRGNQRSTVPAHCYR
jgi:hypothetical protein